MLNLEPKAQFYRKSHEILFLSSLLCVNIVTLTFDTDTDTETDIETDNDIESNTDTDTWFFSLPAHRASGDSIWQCLSVCVCVASHISKTIHHSPQVFLG